MFCLKKVKEQMKMNFCVYVCRFMYLVQCAIHGAELKCSPQDPYRHAGAVQGAETFTVILLTVSC